MASISLRVSLERSPLREGPTGEPPSTTDPFRIDTKEACLPPRADVVAGLAMGEPATERRPTVESSPPSDILSSGWRRGDGAARGLRLPSEDGFPESMLQVLSLRSNLARVCAAGSAGAGEMVRDARRDDGPEGATSGGAEKKRTIKVYSADALSSKRRDSERKSASTGCFCKKDATELSRKLSIGHSTYVCLVIRRISWHDFNVVIHQLCEP